MKKFAFTVAGIALLAVSARAAGTNLAWNDCLPGGGQIDRSVSCADVGSSTMYVSFVPAADFPSIGAVEAWIDVETATQTPISSGSWWFPASANTRWMAGGLEPPSGVCPSWWAGATNGPLTGFYNVSIVDGGARLRIRVLSLIAAGEERVATAGHEYFGGSLTLKFSAGTSGDPECHAGGTLNIHDLVVSQPGVPDFHFNQTPEVSNTITFRNPQDAGSTPTAKSSWGAIKVLYR